MIRVRYHGSIKRAASAAHKGAHKVDAATFAEILSYTEQFYPLRRHLSTGAIDVKIGADLATARPLGAEQVARWSIPQGSVIHIVPNVNGAITTAALVTALITTAISVGVSLLATMLFPNQEATKTDTRKNALYQSGLNTSTAGAPLAYLAGDWVFAGGQIIESDYDYSNSGGAYAYATLGGGGGWNGDDGFSPLDSYSFGKVGGSKGKGSSGGRTISNTTYSDATLRFAMALGSGEIGGIVGDTDEEKAKHILVNQVPLLDPSTLTYNYPGVSWEERLGVAGQDPLKITPGISSTYNDGTALKHQAAGAATQTYITHQVQNAKADIVKLDIRFDQLVAIDGNNNQTATSVTIAADVKRVSAGSWQTAGAWTVNEKSSQSFDRQFSIAAPATNLSNSADPWMFRVYRTTPDSTDDKLQNSTTFFGWVEVEKSDLTYDGSEGVGFVPTALFACALDGASFDVSNKPEIALIVRGRKVRCPDNYDGLARTYSGTWSGNWSYQATANPVWHWLEIATSGSVGCGFPLAMFDKFALLQVAKRCDEQINGRFRYSLNKQFTDQTEGWQFLVDLAQTFRAVPGYDGTTISLTQDAPGTPDLMVNNAQVADGKFAYASTAGAQQYNEVVVQWDDPDDYYRVNQVTYQDTASIARNLALGISNNGVVTKTVYKHGCTNRDEAYDWARALVYDAQNQNETVSFLTTINACAYAPNQRILIDDWNLTGKEITGRVLAVSSGSIQIDNPVTQKANVEYDALLTVDNRLARRAIAVVTTDQVTDTFAVDTTGLDPDTPVSIVANSDGAVQPTQWWINDIEEQETGLYTVSATAYDPRKHDWLDTGAQVAAPTWTNINPITPVPTGLTLSQYSYTDDILGARHGIQASWDAIRTTNDTGAGIALAGYVMEVKRPNSSTWEQVYKGTDNFTSILNADPGEYTFSLRSQSVTGRTSAAEVLTWTLSYSGTDGAVLQPVFLGFS